MYTKKVKHRENFQSTVRRWGCQKHRPIWVAFTLKFRKRDSKRSEAKNFCLEFSWP